MIYYAMLVAIWFALSARKFVTGNSWKWGLYGFCVFFFPGMILTLLCDEFLSALPPYYLEQIPSPLLFIINFLAPSPALLLAIITRQFLINKQKRIETAMKDLI